MEGDFIKINKALLPLSWLYGLAVKLRNAAFELGILKSHAFDVPIVSVGNITVGGTGKTPHVEYLVRLLQDTFHVAVLSRGYKRKSKGYVVAAADTPMTAIGDEPFQMKQKFPAVTVAVDKDRCHGIERLTEGDESLDVVLLDDAFQHRYVKPGINILLVDYHRLIIYDRLLPAGRLREPQSGKNRADVVIVTKCPKDLKPMEYRVVAKALNLFPYQNLFFSTIDYCDLQPLFPDGRSEETLFDMHPSLYGLQEYNVLLLTGIASPEQMVHDLSPLIPHLTPLTFSDHHTFQPADVERINSAYAALAEPRCIVTTEKDAARLTNISGLSADVRKNIYCLPVRVRFMLDQEEMFNQYIIGYVCKNSRNSILAKAKDDHKPKNSHHSGDRSRTISFRNH